MATTAEPHTISVRAPETGEELHLANELMARTYSGANDASGQWLDTFESVYPGFHRDHTRIAFLGEQLAGALRLTTETLRIGEARLKTGGLATVATAQPYRGMGVCTELLEDAHRYMRRHGYDVAMAFGPSSNFNRLGFQPIIDDYIMRVETEELARSSVHETSGLRVRDAKPGDISAIQKMHERNANRVPCSLIRTKAHITNKWGKLSDLKVAIDLQGKVLGYVWLGDEKISTVVLEIGGERGKAIPELLHFISQAAMEAMNPYVEFHLPPPHPLYQALSAIQSATSITSGNDITGQMKFINISETLEHMIPEWEALIAATLVQELRCELTMVVEREAYRIRSNRGAIDITPAMGRNKFSTTRSEFLNMIAGKSSIESTIDRVPRLLNRQGRALLSTLFPMRTPYVYIFDRF